MAFHILQNYLHVTSGGATPGHGRSKLVASLGEGAYCPGWHPN